jgi:uncharacterized protein (TIGR02271 family)
MQNRGRNIRAGMDVLDLNGDKIGSIGDAFGSYMKVDTGFLGLGKDYYIPSDSVTEIFDDHVVVNTTKDRLDTMGWDEKPFGYEEGGPWNTVRTGELDDKSSLRDPGDRGTTGTFRDERNLGTRREGHFSDTERTERKMPLREEELDIQRRQRQSGEVEVTKDIEEEHVRRNVPHTEERVYVERRPASGDVDRGDIGEGEEIRIPVREEEIEVTKRPVTRDEIVIGKETVTKDTEIDETIRREVPRVKKECDVEELDEHGKPRRRSDDPFRR